MCVCVCVYIYIYIYIYEVEEYYWNLKGDRVWLDTEVQASETT